MTAQDRQRGRLSGLKRLVRWIRTLSLTHPLPCLVMNRMMKSQLTTKPGKTEDYLQHHPRPLTLETEDETRLERAKYLTARHMTLDMTNENAQTFLEPRSSL